jgi:hypothetical protein
MLTMNDALLVLRVAVALAAYRDAPMVERRDLSISVRVLASLLSERGPMVDTDAMIG